jgi:hypothetical protein
MDFQDKILLNMVWVIFSVIKSIQIAALKIVIFLTQTIYKKKHASAYMEETEEKSVSLTLEYPEWMQILERILERRKILKEQIINSIDKSVVYPNMKMFAERVQLS